MLATAAAIPVCLLVSSPSRWSPGLFALLVALAIVAELTVVPVGSRIQISGGTLAFALAAVLLGGAPAALLGALTIGASWARSRPSWHYSLINLASYTWSALLTGLAFHFAVGAMHLDPRDSGYYLLGFAACLLMPVLTFAFGVGYQCYLERTSLVTKAREVFLWLLGADLMSAVLTPVGALVALRLGTPELAMFAIVLVVFQYLVGQLLTSRSRAQELKRIATTDGLTGLANRERFREAVEARIAAAGPTGRFAVMLMDLDRFKEVNDTLGHRYGDKLLAELAPRLTRQLGDGGLVARLGGDEFALLPAQDTDSPEELDAIATVLCRAVDEPFAIDELSLEVGASVGVARYPRDGGDAHALLRCADIAMYAAKRAQIDYQVYAVEQDDRSNRRLNVLSDVRRALTESQIVVHFQPLVGVGERSVTGAEGLVRWQHPEHGLVAPGTFIPTVEQTGLIGPLTRLVLERSIAECARWHRAGHRLSIAVNLSVRNLLDRDLPREIERMLDAHGLPAPALSLEITERMIMTDPDRALATVSRLSALGARLSVDDFGTGYSSLENLRRLPIDELKIDRSFVTPMLSDESDLIIVRSTINLARDLGLRTIAEGVEDGATLERLDTLGCDLAQGFHLGRPMDAEDFVSWLSQDRAPTDILSAGPGTLTRPLTGVVVASPPA